MEELKSLKPHSVFIDNRKQLNLTGVTDLESFDEESFFAVTEYGILSVRGSGLQITKLDLNAGELSAEGEFDSLGYTAVMKKGKKSFFRG